MKNLKFEMDRKNKKLFVSFVYDEEMRKSFTIHDMFEKLIFEGEPEKSYPKDTFTGEYKIFTTSLYLTFIFQLE